MALTADDYYRQLVALLPHGPAWSVEDSNFASQLLNGFAQELARIQARADALIDEADPRSSYELLSDLERNFGLPTDCMAGIDQSLQQRRNALVSQMVSVGGQSRAYFIALAAAAGFTITITEFRPFTVGMTVADPLYGAEWAYAWQVNAQGAAVTHFTVASGVNESLSAWGNELLECLLKRYKPAHTALNFLYF